MTQVRAESFTISLDGYGAVPDQSVENPLGVGGEALHDRVVSTRSWRQMHGREGGASGIDDDFAARNSRNIGAGILGRNMFGPIRGSWPDMNWKGWCTHEALDQSRRAAAGMDVRTGGGPNTIRQYLRAGLIDEAHVAIAPVLLGGGERLFEGVDLRALGYECVQFVGSKKATHVVLRRPA
jgi:dihydrofolate reductase